MERAHHLRVEVMRRDRCLATIGAEGAAKYADDRVGKRVNHASEMLKTESAPAMREVGIRAQEQELHFQCSRAWAAGSDLTMGDKVIRASSTSSDTREVPEENRNQPAAVAARKPTRNTRWPASTANVQRPDSLSPYTRTRRPVPENMALRAAQ